MLIPGNLHFLALSKKGRRLCVTRRMVQRGDNYFAENCLLWNSLKSVKKFGQQIISFVLQYQNSGQIILDIQIENRAFVM